MSLKTNNFVSSMSSHKQKMSFGRKPSIHEVRERKLSKVNFDTGRTHYNKPLVNDFGKM